MRMKSWLNLHVFLLILVLLGVFPYVAHSLGKAVEPVSCIHPWMNSCPKCEGNAFEMKSLLLPPTTVTEAQGYFNIPWFHSVHTTSKHTTMEHITIIRCQKGTGWQNRVLPEVCRSFEWKVLVPKPDLVLIAGWHPRGVHLCPECAAHLCRHGETAGVLPEQGEVFWSIFRVISPCHGECTFLMVSVLNYCRSWSISSFLGISGYVVNMRYVFFSLEQLWRNSKCGYMDGI